MRRTNPLFEGDGTTASTTREGDDEATRRLSAGGTLAAAREFATDGSARGARDAGSRGQGMRVE